MQFEYGVFVEGEVVTQGELHERQEQKFDGFVAEMVQQKGEMLIENGFYDFYNLVDEDYVEVDFLLS